MIIYLLAYILSLVKWCLEDRAVFLILFLLQPCLLSVLSKRVAG